MLIICKGINKAVEGAKENGLSQNQSLSEVPAEKDTPPVSESPETVGNTCDLARSIRKFNTFADRLGLYERGFIFYGKASQPNREIGGPLQGIAMPY